MGGRVAVRPQVVMRLDFGFHCRVVERAEQFLVRGLVLLDRHRHPGGVHVVLQVHVLGHDVAAPGPAAETGGHRHPVVERAGVGLRLRLADHDPRHRRRHRKAVDVVLVERVDPAGMTLAAHFVDAAHHLQRLVEAAVLVDGEQRGQLLAGERVFLADAVPVHDDELAVGRDRETGRLRELLRRDGHRVRRPVPLVVPHDAAQLCLFLSLREISAFLLQLREQLVEDRGLDDQVAVGRAARAEIRCLGQPRVARRFLDVGGLVDDHRRVARSDAVGRRAGAVRGAHHGLAAGGDDQVRARHQRLRHRDVHLGQALQDVGRRAFPLQRLAHQSHGLERRLLRARVRREDHAVARLDAVDRVARRRQVRVGRRHDAGDDPGRLAVLDDALLRQLLDDADALLAQRVAQHAANLHPLAHPAHGVAQPALLDPHVDQARERLLVRHRPGHRLAQPVDPRLVVRLDDREGFARTREDLVQFLLLLLGDAFLDFGGGGHLEYLLLDSIGGRQRTGAARVGRGGFRLR